jgi:tRNA (mo5U34)-methyltransferase
MTTTADEQRKTEWIGSQSLTEFLDPNDHSKTIEGYPAPKRAYIKAFKSSK